MKRPLSASRGFTLIEMLVVITIIVLLAALAIPALRPARATQISTAGHEVADALILARQAAISQDRFAEVRFYNVPNGSGTSTFCAYKIYVYSDDESTVTAFSKLTYLPSGIVMDVSSDFDYSSLLSSSLNTTAPLTTSGSSGSSGNVENLPSAPNVPFEIVQFHPSGTTNLDPSQSWFVSIKAASDPEGDSLPAKDFATVQLNPITGRVTYYHP